MMLPKTAPNRPNIKPSLKKSLTMLKGGVPMAAIVPISRIRSNTLIIMTFSMEISTMEIKIISETDFKQMINE